MNSVKQSRKSSRLRSSFQVNKRDQSARRRDRALGPPQGQDPPATTDRREAHSPESRPVVGSNLRRIRTMRGLSLERLARASGVSRAMLGQIELGQSTPTINTIWKIARALNCQFSVLITNRPAGRPKYCGPLTRKYSHRETGNFLRVRSFRLTSLAWSSSTSCGLPHYRVSAQSPIRQAPSKIWL
jgi:transcriptional regulator with XRE-family HTH domain